MHYQDNPLTNTQGGSFWPHLFDPFRDIGHAVSNFFAPTAEASDSEECYEINLELPGVSEDNVVVSVQENVLTIKGEKK